ncbi:hypothetical protein GMA12_12590 [Kocuria sediminis]|uniref:Uncharacterized protein n=1 Tax=Kocuria sediminis TaxID=1038857 RepID=A0A6N8GLH1_9MICC|nr:hypothetical protein [Kocuria sediminis]MUN63966.1 hypothetical protein [Kocuria sediminis]
MPTSRPSRSAAARAAAAAALLLALTGCSLFDREDGAGAPSSSASGSASDGASGGVSDGASVSTVEETCARVLEAARTAPERLQEDPAALLAEVEDLAATAPPELSGQITSIREAVDDYRQGERSMLSVAREARALQERCSG